MNLQRIYRQISLISTILILILNAGCKEASELTSPGEDEKKVQYFKISGKVECNLLPINQVVVTIDHDTTLTNINGEFNIDSLKEGKRMVSFRHDYFANLDSLIEIKEDKQLSVTLTKAFSDLSGYIYFESTPLKDVKIQVGDLIVYTDNLGYFKLPHISFTSIGISISHQNYENLDTLISNNSASEFSKVIFKLKKKQVDYFPLKKGNKWEYDFIESSSSPRGGGSSYLSAGKIKWEVIEELSYSDSLVFVLSQERTDTIEDKIVLNNFKIIQYPNGILFPYGAKITVPFEIKRYYPIDSPEVIAFNSSGFPFKNLEIKKGVGIQKSSIGYFSISNAFSHSYSLKSYTIN
ncbi:MAG: hypothetical protein J0L62_12075 [Bacteroidetes bacterium]|nr:hypothetical protein [Bacteroidota bacterium]